MDEETPSQEEEIKITKHQFYFETPLYRVIKNENFVEEIFDGDVDAYNSQSGFDTTYSIDSYEIGGQYSTYKDFYRVTLKCKRNNRDELKFFIHSDDKITVKIGQQPSLADIQFAEIGKKYDKFLSREDLKEFKRAIGLAAHGAGAGSFVYLRRIFENLIRDTFQDHEKAIGISVEDFKKRRMSEKVEELKDYLPSQLVEMRSIYEVLSKGVHELSEEECLKYFPALKLSIELVLEQRIEIEAKRKKDVAVKKQLEDIRRETKEDKPDPQKST